MKKTVGYATASFLAAVVAIACSSSSSSTASTGAAIGSDCQKNSDCKSDFCNDDPQCTQPCTVAADCPAGSVCETDRPGHCYKECKTNADCAPNTAASQCIGGPNPEGLMWCDVPPTPEDAGGD